MEFITSISPAQWSFYAMAILTLFGGLGTVLSKNPIYSIIYLILTFFSLSGLYILLNAQFVAVVNIIVYAGAIMVLFLFVVMFLNLRGEEEDVDDNKSMLRATIISISLGALLILGVRFVNYPKVNPSTFNSQIGLTENLGNLLYTKYALPFELVSILFLAAMAGAVLLGRKEKGERNF